MQSIPPEPASPPSRVAEGPCPLRFEDVTQDGRLDLVVLPQVLDPVWKEAYSQPGLMAAAVGQGILPILSRLVLEGTRESFSTRADLKGRGIYQLAQGEGEGDGRLFLNMWSTVHGPRGATYPPQPDGAGERVLAGRIFAEHTFTRPFAAKGKRRVTAIPGVETPEARYAFEPYEDLLTLPEGATPLEDAPSPHPLPTIFGLMHTDPNRHVNSLVYPRLFQEALIHRLGAMGHRDALIARRIEIAWRRPCFAGQSVQILLQPFSRGDDLGAVGLFVSGDSGETVHTYLRMTLSQGAR